MPDPTVGQLGDPFFAEGAAPADLIDDLPGSRGREITDEMVERAAIAFYRVGQEGGESLHDWSKRQMRAALEAALADPVGANTGELTPRGRA